MEQICHWWCMLYINLNELGRSMFFDPAYNVLFLSLLRFQLEKSDSIPCRSSNPDLIVEAPKMWRSRPPISQSHLALYWFQPKGPVELLQLHQSDG